MSSLKKGYGSESFQNHVLILENFLLETDKSLPGEQTIYLAGMLARENNDTYRKNIDPFLFQNTEELDILACRHYLYLGQNANLWFISRINAEHLTVQLVSPKKKQKVSLTDKVFPKRCFEVASIYAYKASNRILGGIFAYISNHYDHVLEILHTYLCALEAETLPSPNAQLPKALWKHLGQVRNERNHKKEQWEAMRISEKEKNHLSFPEFNRIMDLSGCN